MGNKYKFQEPYKFKNGAIVNNRIVIPPMTEASSFYDGTVTKDELDYFKLRGDQSGLFISPAASISEMGIGFNGQLLISDDSYIPRLKEMASAMKGNRSKAVLQLFHSGRLSDSKLLKGKKPKGPSSVASNRQNSEVPDTLTTFEVEAIIEEFSQATRRAILSGFDGIELHGATVILFNNFFRPTQINEKMNGEVA